MGDRPRGFVCPGVPAAVGIHEAEAQPCCLLYGPDHHSDSDFTADANWRFIDTGSVRPL